MNEKQNRSLQLSFKGTVVSTLIFGAALLTAALGQARQQGQQQGSMAGMAANAARRQRESKGRCSQREGYH